MKRFVFTVDDNIRVFREIKESRPKSLFDHPYLAAYRRLHERLGLKVQLNLFFEDGKGFSLLEMPSDYKAEWEANADWLRLSFHAKKEFDCSYEFSDYETAFRDCENVQREILRFASEKNLATTTTIHFCMLTEDGLRAMEENGALGLLGLYGEKGAERVSYSIRDREKGDLLREGKILEIGGMHHAGIDIVLNNFDAEGILAQLPALRARESVRVMIHEQFFYEDYERYQPDFEEKLYKTFAALCAEGRKSVFFEELIKNGDM